MGLRDDILSSAVARQEAELKAGAIAVLGTSDTSSDLPEAPSAPGAPSAPVLDPEASEALARSKLLEFSKDELTMLKGLTSAALQKVLSNGADKDKISAAKLVVAMQKLETDKYVELRGQAISAGKGNTTLNVFADADFLGKVAASAGDFRAKLAAAQAVKAEVLE